MPEPRQLIRPEDLLILRENHVRQKPVQGTHAEIDFTPQVLLTIPGTYCLWLLTELIDDETAFGLCQIHMAELGNVWLPELIDLDVRGVRVVQDPNFNPRATLRGYTEMAKRQGGLLSL